MKNVDVFVYEVYSKMMMAQTVKATECDGVEVEEVVDLLSTTISADIKHRKVLWCIFERTDDRGFSENCRLAGRYFESRCAECAE
jgi:hypothetical protein